MAKWKHVFVVLRYEREGFESAISRNGVVPPEEIGLYFTAVKVLQTQEAAIREVDR